MDEFKGTKRIRFTMR